MVAYRRNVIPGAGYFFTVTLLDRASSLLVEHIADLRLAMISVQTERPFEIDAVVVLPDHLHCIWTLPPGDADYALRWREIKSRFSRRIPASDRRTLARMNKAERGIWQRRYWEHTLRDEGDMERHMDYIHYNPVKHGYVTRVADWPYSSFHRWVRKGVYSLDWAGDAIPEAGEFGE
ncbi:MAG: transposase [Gammaproteobacteria bacterium]|nr:transposase [Gammaproteobacteria bacterium]